MSERISIIGPSCREERRRLGLPYPKSSCDECGSLIRVGWRCPHAAPAAIAPAPAVAQDGETDKEQIKAAVERMRAEDSILMSMLTFDESCELAEAALGPLPADKAKLLDLWDAMSKRASLAEADASRLAEAARKIGKDSYISDYDIPQDRSLLVKARQLQALVDALAEHDKLASG